jgi:hypothetical protein
MSSAEQAGRAKRWEQSVYNWLANPLLVAVVGAILVYWLIPQLTRGWQNHQKILDVKTNLVKQMSQSVATTVMTGRFVTSGLIAQASSDPNATQRAFNDAYREWTTSSAAIGAQLAAYFPNSDIGSKWDTFANITTDFFQLSANPSRTRSAQVKEIHDYPYVPRYTSAFWDVLARSNKGAAFQGYYRELSQAILRLRDEFVKQVLKQPATAF